MDALAQYGGRRMPQPGSVQQGLGKKAKVTARDRCALRGRQVREAGCKIGLHHAAPAPGATIQDHA